MPPKKYPKKPSEPEKVWLCELCLEMYENTSPPDVCGACGHTYFDNLQDMMKASKDRAR